MFTESNISKDDNEHAWEVWNTFDINNMREYYNLYLKSDALMLTDVFENFRNICLTKLYGLDPVRYLLLSD